MLSVASGLGRSTRRALRCRSLARLTGWARRELEPGTRRVVGIVVAIVALVTFTDASHPSRTAAAHEGSVVASTPPVAISQATLRFTDSIVVEFGDGPQRVLATDLNGDGNPDLASVDRATVSVLLGKGNATFGKRASYRTARHAAGFAAADVNGDGDPDLITASADRAGSISVSLNHGTGRFQRRPLRARSGPNAYSVAAGDLDQDGKVDLVTAHQSRRALAVLHGEGDGHFRRTHTYGGGRIRDVALGDLNGDARLDAAAVTKGFVVVRVGLGDGSFGPQVLTPTDGSMPWNLVLADFNQDGKLDLVTGNDTGAISVFVGNGDGSFAAAQRNLLPEDDDGDRGDPDAVAVGDLDRDGNLDIAGSASTGPFVLKGRGDGTFLPATFLEDYGTIGAAVADFNRDNWPDLAFIYQTDGESFPSAPVYLNWTGQDAPPCIVPYVSYVTDGSGYSLRRATSMLQSAGCRLGQVRRRYSRVVPTGRVISQRPAANEVLPSFGPVDVVVSRGRKPR